MSCDLTFKHFSSPPLSSNLLSFLLSLSFPKACIAQEGGWGKSTCSSNSKALSTKDPLASGHGWISMCASYLASVDLLLIFKRMRNSAHRTVIVFADQGKVEKKESDYQSSLLFQVLAPILYLALCSFKKSCRENIKWHFLVICTSVQRPAVPSGHTPFPCLKVQGNIFLFPKSWNARADCGANLSASPRSLTSWSSCSLT